MTRRSRGIPVLFRWLKQALAGIVLSKSFSICLLVIRASLLEALTISLYVISDAVFFWRAPEIPTFSPLIIDSVILHLHFAKTIFPVSYNSPDILIHIWGRRECGMPRLTISRSLSVRGNRWSTSCHDTSEISLLWVNSRWATHCNLFMS